MDLPFIAVFPVDFTWLIRLDLGFCHDRSCRDCTGGGAIGTARRTGRAGRVGAAASATGGTAG